MLKQNEVLVFAIACTAEGYIPTHNQAFNHPPCGIRCGSHQQTLLQTYTRDTSELMHDLAVPIYVQGRHWCGLRLGCRPEG